MAVKQHENTEFYSCLTTGTPASNRLKTELSDVVACMSCFLHCLATCRTILDFWWHRTSSHPNPTHPRPHPRPHPSSQANPRPHAKPYSSAKPHSQQLQQHCCGLGAVRRGRRAVHASKDMQVCLSLNGVMPDCCACFNSRLGASGDSGRGCHGPALLEVVKSCSNSACEKVHLLYVQIRVFTCRDGPWVGYCCAPGYKCTRKDA